MVLKVLTQDQEEQFVEEGYAIVRGTFAAETAAAVRAELWKTLADGHGIDPDECGTWPKPMVHIQESYSHKPFSEAWTERLVDAIGDLAGHGRFRTPKTLGWWPVAFPGFDAPPWTPPEKGWHIDGIQFHHRVNSPDQGLLLVLILSQIDPGGGGTAIVPGSHKITARILNDAEPDGLEIHTLCGRAVEEIPRDRVVEATGAPGDAMLLHPFMLHARSPNTGQRTRFICNPCISLHEPMNVSPDNADPTPVERAIIRSLAERDA